MGSISTDHAPFRMARIGGADGPAGPQHEGHLAAVSYSGSCREDIRRGDSCLNGRLVRIARLRPGTKASCEPWEKWKPLFVKESVASSRTLWAVARRIFAPICEVISSWSAFKAF